MAHENEDPKNLLILSIGLGSIVVLGLALFGLSSYYRMLRDEQLDAKILSRSNPQLIEMRAEEHRKLTTYAALDANKTHVRIPIDQAMKTLAQKGRDGIPSIQPDPATIHIGGAPATAPAESAAPATSAAPAGSAAPADSAAPAGSAAPATSASAAPATSAVAPAASAQPGDKKE